MTNEQAFTMALQRVTQSILIRHLKLQEEGRASTHALMVHMNRSFGQLQRQARERAERSRRKFHVGGFRSIVSAAQEAQQLMNEQTSLYLQSLRGAQWTPAERYEMGDRILLDGEPYVIGRTIEARG